MKFSALLGIARPLISTGIAVAEPSKQQVQKAIVLYCDLAIDPAREQEMLHQFHTQFKPAAEKFEGYIDVKIVKLRKVVQGRPAPASNINYRFQLTYRSEELRQRWIASDVHARVWPLIENTVTNRDYLVLLTDNA
ncbi:hypothetical protein AB4Y89_00645 [Terriglobus sp. 2YAB30_2]|uniref:hypothetical protein n=1 Tax=unclassified Terriglobus TaxID=2628988 RepID=UPI003F9E046B